MKTENANVVDLAGFQHAITVLQSGIKREYDRSVNRDLSQQQFQDVFKRNVSLVLRTIYQQSLDRLQQFVLETDPLANQKTDQGQQLSSILLQSFDGVIEELIVYALQKHRSSCALSNFPDEHNPSEAYLAEVIDEASRDWSAFNLQVKNLLTS